MLVEVAQEAVGSGALDRGGEPAEDVGEGVGVIAEKLFDRCETTATPLAVVVVECCAFVRWDAFEASEDLDRLIGAS